MNSNYSSVNQPWAISDKYKERYGKIWSEMDFEINNRISNYHFRNDPLNTDAGTLLVCGKKIPMKYKQLLSTSTIVREYATAVYFDRPGKHERFAIEFGNNTLVLKKHEIGKLSETLQDSVETIMKSYQLGHIYNK